jgi:effector-binding domain-containing protein
MNAYDVRVVISHAHPIAAVRARVALDRIAEEFRGPLDKVWAFLRSHPELKKDGHNLFLYHHPSFGGGAIDIDFGVQVAAPFAGEGEVACVPVPAGEAVSTLHRGPYSGLRGAHDAIHRWLDEHKRRSPASWEIYGDWSEDPEKLETEVVYLLD